MHDPMTVAFEIRYPWRQKGHQPWPRRVRRYDDERAWSRMTDAEKSKCSRSWRDGYRHSFITIWHVDPERDGSDDSCGYSVPHLTREQRERMKALAWSEARDPYFLKRNTRTFIGSRAEAEAIYRGMLLAVARHAHVPLTFDEAAREAALEIHKPDCCDAADGLCFEPGYHTNFNDDLKDMRQDYAYGKFCGILAWMLKDRRPWWRHPKWHIHHWKIQCHPVQTFKRWLFSRCSKCGKGFSWGYAPCSNSWHGTGPRWFRGERDVYHHDCAHPREYNVAKSQAVEQPA